MVTVVSAKSSSLGSANNPSDDGSGSSPDNAAKNNPDKMSNVQTGDGNNIFLYCAMLIVSVFGLTTLKRRKEKRKL